ncbi:hypothetical protein LWI28_012682 [Acer negundo]|uniref:Uncharacterized protein n=1 Tax=Acer negundo TaxID=4023 RepID=A0AAD5P483_ACENE|nr:hypothetical protein LWI28_012682 [Acer negundo]
MLEKPTLEHAVSMPLEGPSTVNNIEEPNIPYQVIVNNTGVRSARIRKLGNSDTKLGVHCGKRKSAPVEEDESHARNKSFSSTNGIIESQAWLFRKVGGQLFYILCLLWSANVNEVLMSYSLAHIDVRLVSSLNKWWRFTEFYGSPDSSQRLDSWSLLCRLAGMSNLP